MIRTVKHIFSFSKGSSFTVNNIFNGQPVGSFTSPSREQVSLQLNDIKIEQQRWRDLALEQKEKNILTFIEQFKASQAIQHTSSLLSACTGKEISECEAQLRTALRIFNYQLGYLYRKSKDFGSTCYRFEPFDVITSVFDHRQPLISAFAYFAIALRSNNALFLRPSPSVLPVISHITSLWTENTSTSLVRCLADKHQDPKHSDSPIRTILNETEGFVSFWGRLKEGLDFHYYISQSNQVFRENEFMLTSSDSAYVMKDLSSTQLEQVASQVARGCFSNCGHNFNSIKRVFVDREVSDEFQTLLLEKAKEYSISESIAADFSKIGTNDGKLAPFLIASEFEESKRLLEEIKEKHSKQLLLLEGGQPVTLKSGERQLNLIGPTIIRVEADFPTFNYQNEESMMPICYLSIVDSPQLCVEKINSSIFGTTATLFTNQLDKAYKLAQMIEVGTVNVNTWEVVEGVPYSGRKRSGKGFSLSPLSFNNIVRSKSISFP